MELHAIRAAMWAIFISVSFGFDVVDNSHESANPVEPLAPTTAGKGNWRNSRPVLLLKAHCAPHWPQTKIKEFRHV
jgi:hypothetical protein